MQSESFRNARFNLKGATMQYYQIIKQIIMRYLLKVIRKFFHRRYSYCGSFIWRIPDELFNQKRKKKCWNFF